MGYMQTILSLYENHKSTIKKNNTKLKILIINSLEMNNGHYLYFKDKYMKGRLDMRKFSTS